MSVNLATGRGADGFGGIDTFSGFGAVRGGFVNDTLVGSAGNDRFSGLNGSNPIAGGGGFDMVDYLRNQGNVTVDLVLGRGGLADTLDYGQPTGAVSVSLVLLRAQDGQGGTDTVLGFEHVLGGAGADTLVGSSLANRLVGGAGKDTLDGRAGNDTLDGGEGIDRLFGSLGDDVYIVTAGDLVIEAAGQGTDTVFATTGTAYALGATLEALVLSGSTLVSGVGNAAANAVIGNAGANVLQGRDGQDTLSGGLGNDVLIGGAQADTLEGGGGSDQFRYLAASESAGAGADVILDFTFSAALGIDRIDLRGIDANAALAGDQAFAWIGAAAFPGGGAPGAGRLRDELLDAGVYAIEGDIDGNGSAELSITVVSAFTPVQAWFLLRPVPALP